MCGGRHPRPDPPGHPEQEGATSSFQAVIEEAGVPLGWEGVEGKVLGLSRGELHVGPVLILVVLERLVSPVQRADVRLGRQLGGDEPLPHDAFGDHRVFFAGGEGKTVSRRGEGRGDTQGHRVHVPEPHPPPQPPGPEQSPPLQPGHTQVTVVTAPESLGERVVLNFQLCDLSGEEAQRSHGQGGGELGQPCPLPQAHSEPRAASGEVASCRSLPGLEVLAGSYPFS